MTRKLFLGSLFFLLVWGNTLSAQISISNFLQGTWKIENRESYEYWGKLDDSSFNGFSYQLKNGEMKVSEFLEISYLDDKIIYRARVVNQNQGRGIPFSLTASDSAYIFENPAHDFPKKIVYHPINQTKVKVTVSDDGKKGFSYFLHKVTNQINIASSGNNEGGKQVSIPDDLLKNWEILTSKSGIWTTDNSKYKSQNEPYDQYQLFWKFDDAKNSLTGKLYGIQEGKEKTEFWNFHTFWDAVKQKAIVFQISPNGSYGIAESEMLSDSLEQSLGVFHYSNGLSESSKHQSITKPTEHTTISFSMDENGNWIKNRTYVWYPVSDENNASSKLDTLQSGELMLKQEIVVNAPVERLWQAYTTEKDWKEWVTPIVEMDFKINGTIKSHYDPKAKIGDKGTIVIHILNYIPNKQITMQAEVAENFPEFMKGEEKNLYSIVEFSAINNSTTKVSLYGIGYKNEQRWLDLMKFFIQGNEMTLNNLKKFVEQ